MIILKIGAFDFAVSDPCVIATLRTRVQHLRSACPMDRNSCWKGGRPTSSGKEQCESKSMDASQPMSATAFNTATCVQACSVGAMTFAVYQHAAG